MKISSGLNIFLKIHRKKQTKMKMLFVSIQRSLLEKGYLCEGWNSFQFITAIMS